MLDKNQLSTYLWFICKLSNIFFNFITKKTNYANIKLAFLLYSIQMQSVDNKNGEIQGFLPKYEILQEFPKQFHMCIKYVQNQQGFSTKFNYNEQTLNLNSNLSRVLLQNNMKKRISWDFL